MNLLSSLSFSLDNNNNNNYNNNNNNQDCARLLRDRIKSLHPQLNNVVLNNENCITLIGSTLAILNAKSDLLKLKPIEVKLYIHTLYPGLAFRKLARLKLQEQLKLIAINNEIQIIMDYNDIVIRLIGSINNVEKARIDTLLYFDHLLGLMMKSINVPVYMINIIGNRKHADMISIMEETGTNIYCLKMNGVESTIYITGNTNENIQKAIQLLEKLISKKHNSICTCQSILNPRKRDWLLLNKKHELDKIMRDNGSFITFSNFGVDNLNQITVYAESNINVERTLRSLNYLTSQIFQAIIYVNFIQSADLVTHLSKESGAEVIYLADLNKFEIIGTKEQVFKIAQIIRGQSISQEHHVNVIFSIELAEDQKEFISGKKNGKINKIMKSCDAMIQYQQFNNYNFIITIESDDFFKAKDGLESLQNELPAELSFFVPEICHRRIIGVGGKNIQKVMKEFGVYVKFSSNNELKTFGGYFENEHNVIARTPEKNIQALQKLKSAVMEFITFQKDRDYITKQEYVPYYNQRTLLHYNGKFLVDKGRLYNSRITWPERNGANYLSITGPLSHIEEMQLRIQSLLPQYLDIPLPASVALEEILNSGDPIEDLQQSIYSKTKIFLILPNMLSQELHYEDDAYQIDDPFLRVENPKLNMDCNFIFRLCYDVNTKPNLTLAKELFNSFMENRFIPLTNSSPTIDDVIGPSVLYHIEHPESYEVYNMPQQLSPTINGMTPHQSMDKDVNAITQQLKSMNTQPEKYNNFKVWNTMSSNNYYNNNSYYQQPNDFSKQRMFSNQQTNFENNNNNASTLFGYYPNPKFYSFDSQKTNPVVNNRNIHQSFNSARYNMN